MYENLGKGFTLNLNIITFWVITLDIILSIFGPQIITIQNNSIDEQKATRINE